MAENKHYLSSGELRKIAKENRRQTKLYEKKKHRKVSPETYTTQMKDPNNILEIEDLHTFFFTDAGTVKSVNGVTFSIPRGKIVGVVGESGCGKSVTSLSVMQLVQSGAESSGRKPEKRQGSQAHRATFRNFPPESKYSRGARSFKSSSLAKS